MEWSLQPVMLRQEFITKEIRRLLRGGVGMAGRAEAREPHHQRPHTQIVLRRGCLRPLLRRGRRLVAVSGAAPDTAGL